MVGFRVFDVGLLILWLVWFFRLRDDEDDETGDDGPGGGGPELIRRTRSGRRRARSCLSERPSRAGGCATATGRGAHGTRRGVEPMPRPAPARVRQPASPRVHRTEPDA